MSQRKQFQKIFFFTYAFEKEITLSVASLVDSIVQFLCTQLLKKQNPF